MGESSELSDPLIGTTVGGKYRVERRLGRGGMGSVYLAHHVDIEKRVALKLLLPAAAGDAGLVERFEREAKAASRAESPHIVHVFDSGRTADGTPYLVMEYLEGEDLRARLTRDGKLDFLEAVDIGRQIASALVRAHAAGVLHRDLKPENIFLTAHGDNNRFVKLVDFGISKLVGERLTKEPLTQGGTLLGTVAYMAPEQAQALPDLDARADLYAVGAVLYECLTGRPPHVRPTPEALLVAICSSDPEAVAALNPAVPPDVARMVHTALARERDQRFDSADAMLRELQRCLDARPAGRRHESRHPRLVWALGALALLLLAVLLDEWGARRASSEPPTATTGANRATPVPPMLEPSVAGTRHDAVDRPAANPARAPHARIESPAVALVAPSSQPAAQKPTPRAIPRVAPSTRPPPPRATSAPRGVASDLTLSTKEP